jgi:hypothetical protein
MRCGDAQSSEAMVEQANSTGGAAGEDGAPAVAAPPLADPGRRPAWRRPRWLTARPRPPWWEVPPQGYLEVESRKGPTSPRALRTLARAAVNAGLSWSPGNPLPLQRFVEAQERAHLAFQARRELPRVTAVTSQVMLLDSRLAEAEEALRQAADHRSAAAAVARGARDQRATAAGPATAGRHPAGSQRSPDKGRDVERPAQALTLDPWSEAAILAVMAGGQAVLVHAAAGDAGLGVGTLGLLALVAAVGSIVAAQLAARGLRRLGASPEGRDDPRRRRQLDVAVAGGALACGVTLAMGIGQLGRGAGPPALGLALLGLATAGSYAAGPHGAAASTDGSRWRSVTSWLRRQRHDRRSRRQLQAALDREAAAQAAVRRLREELAVLVPQLFAAEQSALLFWRYQVAVGDATQRGFEQQLAAYSMRRSRGAWRPISEWWRGATPAPRGPDAGFVSVGADQPDWGEQVARITMAAKRVLVRRGLLDITHGLRRPLPPGASAVAGNGGPAVSGQDRGGDGHHQPVDLSGLDYQPAGGQPDGPPSPAPPMPSDKVGGSA